MESILYNAAKDKLISASNHKEIKLWDLVKSTCISTLFGHNFAIYDLALEGTTLVSVGREKVIRIWDLRTNKCQHVLNGHSDSGSKFFKNPN